MQIISYYSHKQGLDYLRENHSIELNESCQAISEVRASSARIKKKGKTKHRPVQFSSDQLIKFVRDKLVSRGWVSHRLWTEVTVDLVQDLPEEIKQAYRDYRYVGYPEIDFCKNHLGLEFRLGRPAFLIQMFRGQRIIDSAVAIVPMKKFADSLTARTPYFEQIKADLWMRGVADIDIPVLVLGIEP